MRKVLLKIVTAPLVLIVGVLTIFFPKLFGNTELQARRRG